MKLNIEVISLFTQTRAAVLTCDIDGLPPTSVTWTLNDTAFGSNSSISLTSQTGTTYVAIVEENSLAPGEYRCNVISNGTKLLSASMNASVSFEKSSLVVVEGTQNVYLSLKPCLWF